MTEGPVTRDIYLSAVVGQVPRLLGLLNRNSCSVSYGCFDRNYWHYRVVDTPSARCQEAVLTLALLYRIPGTEYSGRECLVTWARACLDFWLKIQQPNGSFNEWYPNENSFVATAFSSYAISETVLLLDSLVLDSFPAVEKGLIKAGRWLIKNGEARAVNQFAGSALALYNLYLITGDTRFEKAATERVVELRRLQSEEGWFAEYGGADIGYLSLTVAYLAKLYRKSGWRDVLDLSLASIEFIKNFLHRDFTSGGEYCSRLTEYLIPDGFEILSRESCIARTISLFVREELRREKGVSVFSFDDRYLTYVAYNFLEAFNYGTAVVQGYEDPIGMSNNSGIFMNFPEAGLTIISNRKFQGIINTHRGGCFKFIFDNGATISDSGTILISKTNKVFYSGFWNGQTESIVEKNSVLIRGRFGKVNESPLNPWGNILFRVFQMTVGRIGRIGLKLKNLLRDFLIMPPQRKEISYERVVKVKDELVSVKDTISCSSQKFQIEKVVLGSRDSFLYTPSSKFFNPTDLTEGCRVVIPVSLVEGRSRVEISRLYALDGKLLDLGVTES